MTPIFLITNLTESLREVVKSYELLAENQPNKKVSVYAHDLPHGKFAEDTFYPCVIVTLLSVEDTETDTVATVQFTICTYAGEMGSDWRDMLNIAERIRQFLRTTDILTEKYIREYPIGFEPVNLMDQPSPFILGRMACRFRISSPQPVMKWNNFPRD